MTSDEIRAALREPFPVEALGFRPQNVKGNRCLAFPYIDARDVQDRLDAVVGVHGWQDEYHVLPDGSVMCQLRVKIGGEWLTKADVGSPSEQPDQGDRTKAAVSDALKRAAVKYGVGRYLYAIPDLWADYDPQARKVKTPQLPAWALPKGAAAGQQQRPAPPQRPAQPQPENPPAKPQQSVSVADVEGAVGRCEGMVEVEQLVLAARQHLQHGRIPEDQLPRLQAAVSGKAAGLVSRCESEAAAKECSGVYKRGVMGFLTEDQRNRVVAAFNALKARFDAAGRQQADNDPYNQ